MGLMDKLKSLFSHQRANKSMGMDSYDSHKISEYSKSETNTVNSNQQTESKMNALADKAKEFVENTAEEVKEQGAAIWEDIKKTGSDIDEATKEYRQQLKDKAKETLRNIDQFIDETVDKAKELQQKEHELDKDKDGIADSPVDFGKSVFDEKNEFFTKAEKMLKEKDQSESEEASKSEDHKIIHRLDLPKDPE
jgi:ABC-type transporter Mla subunit MlaD